MDRNPESLTDLNRKLLRKLSPIAAKLIQTFSNNKGILLGIFTTLSS
ncbi:hypothetical protein N9V90_02930 [Endozoicomonas sp.]|nr:hypothetical protein [Endozoicomonas sp.]